MSRLWSGDRSAAPSTAQALVEELGARLPDGSAREYVTSRVAELAQAGSLDAGNGDVLDAWLEGLRDEWHARHAAERTARVAAAQEAIAGLEADAVHAEQQAEAAAAEVRHTERVLGVLEKRILGHAEQQPGEGPERRRRPRPTLDPLEGLVRPWFHRGLITLLVVLAAFGDVATFYVVLAKEFRDGGELVVWTLTIAFAAASVGLMHSVGRALKDLREARGGLGRPALALMLAGWVVLGAVAFVFRLASTTPDTAVDSPFGAAGAADQAAAVDHALLSAILLAGLFLASGLLAFYAGFSEHHPRVHTYRALRKRLPAQRQEAATAAREVVRIRTALEHARGEEARAARAAADGIAAADAEIDELKELVRVEVAGHLGQPAATNGLTTGRRAAAGRRAGPAPSSSSLSQAHADAAGPGPASDTASEHRDGAPVWRIPRTSFPVLAARRPSLNGNGTNGSHPSAGS